MFKKLLSILFSILTALLVIFALLLVSAKLIGGGVYTVLSGSMQPTYQVGSLIYVKPIEYKDLQINDPITFALSNDFIVTHRIIEIIEDENDSNILWFKTKGDANKYEDAGLVNCRNVIGKPIFAIPLVGYLINYIQSGIGKVVVTVLIIFLLLYSIMPILDKGKDS